MTRLPGHHATMARDPMRIRSFTSLLRIAAATAVLLASPAVHGQASLMPAPPPGLVETGAPSFVVLGPQALGLSSPPTDIHELPDGRILVVAAQELAIGDGARWEAFSRHPDTEAVELTSVVIDRNSQIHASVRDGFARIEFGDDARWRFVRVAPFPEGMGSVGRVLSEVSDVRGEWYWTAGSGALVAWHPGRTGKVLGTVNDPEPVLPVGDSLFVSDSSTGAVFRLEGDDLVVFDAAETRKVSRTFLCSAPLPDGRAIVGTYTLGALVFDGQDMRPLATRGPLAGGYRIVDICATGTGYFCAALDNLGLVFFAQDGRIVQVLDRSMDHRLARVRRLLHTPGGVVWALLNEGIAQVEFPSRVSRFESLVTTGLTYVQLCRFEGRLWLLADGKAQRGVYDADGRLLRFEVDSPDSFVSTILATGNRLLLATSSGIFQRADAGWEVVADGITNAHISAISTDPDRWLIVAQNEVASMRTTANGLSITRKAVPDMGSSFGIIIEAEGAFWAELGTGRVARIVPRGEDLDVRLFGRGDGLPDAWVQAFLVDGVVRFNVAGQVLRHDETTGRIVPDTEFLRNAPGLVSEHGRPARDSRGRLWVTTRESVSVVDDSAAPSSIHSLERMPAAFNPIAFTMETQGVVWMHQRPRLMRFDPAMPEPEIAPVRAIISHVNLPGSSRNLVFVGPSLPDLDYHDNSLVAHFLAPNTVFGHPVTFEVLLEGASDVWVPTGAAGSASFNQLKEGSYLLRVRPRAGATTGTEATLAFTIRPPWFRTTAAYAIFTLAVAGVVVASAAGWSLLARREKARLERLVTARTAELRRSEENYRRLNEGLEQRVHQRTTELHLANDRLVETNRELESFSYSISHDLRAPLRGIDGWSLALEEDCSAALDETGRGYLQRVRAETRRLGQLIDDLLKLARTTRAECHPEAVDLSALAAETAQRVQETQPGRRTEFACQAGLRAQGDPNLLGAALFNLMDNAWKFSSKASHPSVEFGLADTPHGPAYFVRDNGAGFDMRHARKLFGVFQRMHTQEEFPGTGVGLATVQRIIHRHGGRIWAESDPGTQTTFFFTLPRVDD